MSHDPRMIPERLRAKADEAIEHVGAKLREAREGHGRCRCEFCRFVDAGFTGGLLFELRYLQQAFQLYPVPLRFRQLDFAIELMERLSIAES